MLDLGKQKITVKCTCGKAHSAMLQDAINRKIVRCSCGSSLQLKDSKGSVRKGVNDINRAFKDLENTLKRLGK